MRKTCQNYIWIICYKHCSHSSKRTTTILIFLDPVKPKINKPEKNRNIPIGDGSPVTGAIGDNVTALPNTSITITCSATGVPRPLIGWRKNGQTVSDGMNIHIAMDGTLTLHSAQIADRGMYTCEVKNSGGTDSISTQIDIKGESQWFMSN